jgi:hypothetical protein
VASACLAEILRESRYSPCRLVVIKSRSAVNLVALVTESASSRGGSRCGREPRVEASGTSQGAASQPTATSQGHGADGDIWRRQAAVRSLRGGRYRRTGSAVTGTAGDRIADVLGGRARVPSRRWGHPGQGRAGHGGRGRAGARTDHPAGAEAGDPGAPRYPGAAFGSVRHGVGPVQASRPGSRQAGRVDACRADGARIGPVGRVETGSGGRACPVRRAGPGAERSGKFGSDQAVEAEEAHSAQGSAADSDTLAADIIPRPVRTTQGGQDHSRRAECARRQPVRCDNLSTGARRERAELDHVTELRRRWSAKRVPGAGAAVRCVVAAHAAGTRSTTGPGSRTAADPGAWADTGSGRCGPGPATQPWRVSRRAWAGGVAAPATGQ